MRDHLRVKIELDMLEEAAIIEDVTSEPTPWFDPRVKVPKGEQFIRIYLDTRNANTAINKHGERTWCPTHTVEYGQSNGQTSTS